MLFHDYYIVISILLVAAHSNLPILHNFDLLHHQISLLITVYILCICATFMSFFCSFCVFTLFQQ